MRKIKSLLAVGVMAMVFTLAQSVTPTSKLANQVSPCITVDAKTTSRSLTYKLKNKHCWLGINVGGATPKTSNWSSSNSKVATVSSKGDSDGAHKVTFKSKGKATISCKIAKTSGHWKKGDVYKWTITVK